MFNGRAGLAEKLVPPFGVGSEKFKALQMFKKCSSVLALLPFVYKDLNI